MEVDPTTVPLEALDTLWHYDDPEGSEKRFVVLARRARIERGGALLAEALTQLARAQGLQRKLDEACETLAEAERALRPDDVRGRVRVLLERGRVERFEEREGRGREAYLEAWELARAAGEDELAVDAAHMLGIVEALDESTRWNDRAMELALSSPDPDARRWVGSLANNMGWARHAAGDDEGAIALFELSRDVFLADGREARARIARWSIAHCLRLRGDVEAALAQQAALLADLDTLGEADGFVFEEIGECLLALGKDHDARPFFARAHAELAGDLRLQSEEPERLNRIRSLAGQC